MKRLGFKFKVFFIWFGEPQLHHRGLEYTNPRVSVY